ncbi:MAG: hypothetical protein IJV64_05700 [Oscillospiraceae bacterium]|nr:hypothetical protein [Oscillospiraceae bacterium]
MEIFENKKALIITGAVLVGIIAIAAAVALIMRGRGGERFGRSDVPYPYSWVEKENGTITLTMETGGAANGAWSVGSTEGAAVEIETGKTKGGKTEVKLTSAEVGSEAITFTLMSGEDRLAELSFTVSVSSGENTLTATAVSHRERTFQGTVRGGEETGHPFAVRGGDEGLTIFVEESEGYTDSGVSWWSESTDALVAFVSSIDVSAEGITVQLETRANGTAEVRVYNVTENISFVFDVQVTGGEMLLTDSRTEPYETAEEAGEAETAENEAAS